MTKPSDEIVYEFAEANVDKIIAAAQSNDFLGFCVLCGEEAYHIDPDACGDPCDACQGRGVYGAEELVLYAVA